MMSELSILDHPSIRAVRASRPLVLRSDGTPDVLPPDPPTSGITWVVRCLALAGILPSLSSALQTIPAGWIGILEIAAHALDRQGLARGLRFLQIGAHGSTLALWPDTIDLDPSAGTKAVQAICEWAEVRSGDTCMALGKTGAGLVTFNGQRLTLCPKAQSFSARELRRLIWPGRHNESNTA